MSQPSNPHFVWDGKERLYAEYRSDGFKWVFVTWMPRGWTPQQPYPQPQEPPKTPRQPNASGRDSTYGSSPLTARASPNQGRLTYSATPITTSTYGSPGYHYGSSSTFSASAYPQAGHPQASSSSNVEPFPKGQGVAVRGHYSAEAGTQPDNLHYETLDPSYYVRDRRFFAEGKVFSVIFSEGAGANAVNFATSYNKCISEVRFTGNHVYTQARRFVIVRLRREFCFACPVFTYSERATLKDGVNPEEHGIIYSDSPDSKPELLSGEKGIKKASIGVTMASGVPKLHIASRIYYGIHHPIQYNVKVKEIGQVLPHHVPVLIGNWKAENGVATRQAADVTAMGDDPNYPHFPEDSEDDSDEVTSKKRGKLPAKAVQKDLHSPPSDRDPHLYHPKKNKNGYDAIKNPHMYHPEHNQYGYHPKHNTIGHHPSDNPFSYHPTHNRHGYHPRLAPFCYHPQFSRYGYHGQKNELGYHPVTTPYNYHPDANPTGYHPKHNKHGHHPKYNIYAYHPKEHPYGYHPKLYPDSYHPKWRPNGTFYTKAKQVSAVSNVGGQAQGYEYEEGDEESDSSEESVEEEEEDEEDEEEDEEEEVHVRDVYVIRD